MTQEQAFDDRCSMRTFVYDWAFMAAMEEHDDGDIALLAGEMAVHEFDRSTLQ